MKKIFLLTFLFLLFSSKPVSAAGQACCDRLIPSGDVCVDTSGKTVGPNACDASKGERCAPNNTCTTEPVTKDPSCPGGQSWKATKKCCVSIYDRAQQCTSATPTCPDPIYSKYENGLCMNPTGAKNLWDLKNRCDNTSIVGIQTALGCVPTKDLNGFLTFLLKFALGISGGVILLLVISTGYTVLTSAGNPEKLQAAKENIVALFTGLLLIAFSLILLQTIGRDILNLPTF